MARSERACQDLSERLHRATTEKQNVDLRTSAELDDLYRTKINLEERLIQLIRYIRPPPSALLLPPSALRLVWEQSWLTCLVITAK